MNPLRQFAKHPAISLVDTCSSLREIKQIHSHLLIAGLLNDPQIIGQFVASVALKHPGEIDYSNRVLDQCENPTLFPLNTMIRFHSKSSTPEKGFQFYYRILRSNHDLSPDNYTFSFLIRTCSQLSSRPAGLAVHAAVIRRGFEQDPHIQSGLVCMYAELGLLDAAHKVFDNIPQPDLVTQTSMVTSLAKSNHLDVARKLFDEMPKRDPVAWNAMIAGYTHSGQPREALNLFQAMAMEGVKLNESTMVSLLSACTQLQALDHGRWAHSYIERENLPITITLGTALVDMYAKSGDIAKAMDIFWKMKEKNVYTWSSAIGGLAMNGLGPKCLELFSLMKQQGISPNEVTFVSVLKGCVVAELIQEAEFHFDSMRNVYGIEPRLEHYGCMVDLYGRSGRLDSALGFINQMPVRPHVAVWGALLNASRIYKNTEMGELASRRIMEIEGGNHGAFVELSNIYADSKNWEGVGDLREEMKSRGVKKVPGCSVLEVEPS